MSTNKEQTSHFERINGRAHLVFDAPTVWYESAEIARYDATVTVEPCAVPLKALTIGGEPTDEDNAYWFVFAEPVSGVLRSGGYPDEVPGETIRPVHCQAYGYVVRKAVLG